MPRPSLPLASPQTDNEKGLQDGDYKFDAVKIEEMFVARSSQFKGHRRAAYTELQRVLTDLKSLGCPCIAVSGHLFDPSWPALGSGRIVHANRAFVVFTIAAPATTEWGNICNYIESNSDPLKSRGFVEVELCSDSVDDCKNLLERMTKKARRARLWILKQNDAA